MKSADQTEIWSLLLKATTYRAFMHAYVEWMKGKKPGFGYASLGRQAGFAARSYPRDVINATRSLTADSILRFTEAMNLTGEAARYFYLLVCVERPELHRDKKDENLEQALKATRARLTSQIANRRRASAKVFHRNDWPLIYASLGDPLNGASPEEVSSRSRLPMSVCLNVFDQMVRADLVVHDKAKNRYFSRNAHLVCEDLGSDEGFKNFFLSSLKRAENHAKKDFEKTDRLFFSSAISVRRSRLRAYRQQLRELLNNFAETSESPTGDDVVTIVCGLFPQGD